MINYIRDVVSQEIKKTEIIKHISATVVEVIDKTNNGKAIVNVMGRNLILLNKTGEILEKNDAVVIHYWDNIANGYIALRCGLPKPSGGLYIKSAVTITKPKSSIKDFSNYIGNVYSSNKYKNNYEIAPNIFFVNGCPAYLTKQNVGSQLINYYNDLDYSIGIKTEIKSIDYDYFLQTISIKKQNSTAGVVSIDNESYYTHISYSNNIQGNWGHRIGLYSETDVTFLKQCDDVYFKSLSSFDHGGIIIVCTDIYPLKSKYCPYGYIHGFLAVRYDGGQIYDITKESTYSTDLIYADTKPWTMLFNSSEERDYAINIIKRSNVIPSLYNG